jgi:hypothetical protein
MPARHGRPQKPLSTKLQTFIDKCLRTTLKIGKEDGVSKEELVKRRLRHCCEDDNGMAGAHNEEAPNKHSHASNDTEPTRQEETGRRPTEA